MKYLENAHHTTTALAQQLRSGTINPAPAPLLKVLEAEAFLSSVMGRPFAGESHQAALQSLADELFRTGALPDGWIDRLVDAHRSVERTDQMFAAVSSWHGQAEWRLKSALNEHRDALLDSIRASLLPVIARLRTSYDAVGEMSLDEPDPMAVAKASEEARSALVSISEDTDTYVSLRLAQVTVHAAEARPPHADHGVTWLDVQRSGIFELRKVTTYPLYPAPPEGETWGIRDSVRAVLGRPDVWVPTTAQLHEAWTAVTRLPAVVNADAEVVAKAGTSSLTDLVDHRAWR